MVKQATFAPDLIAAVGEERLAPGDESSVVDGLTPSVLVTPQTYDDVQGLLGYANAHRLAVIPLGGRQHVGLGNTPARYDIAVDMRRLNSVVEFEPADLTITCRAGLSLGELRRVTAERGLMVPFDPSISDEATIGGLLAAHVSGPARISLGQPRDFTIGMRVVTADGRLTRAGGKVVKNVAGYDLCKLYIGSLGTLVVIVEATFKTIPLPHKELSLAFDFADPESACRHVCDAVRAGLKVRSSLLTRELSRVDLAGTPHAVARSEFDIAAAASALGAKQVAWTPAQPIEAPIIARIDALPSRLAALLVDVANAVPEADIAADPWDGVCRVGLIEPSEIETLREIVARHAAPCVIERCPVELKREFDVFGPLPSAFPLMQAIKREFDPNGVLSPGRFVGRL